LEVRKLGDHQLVFNHSLDEALSVKKVLELLEVDWISWLLTFKGIYQSLELVVGVDAGQLDMVEYL
jgi:hypothetical protein